MAESLKAKNKKAMPDIENTVMQMHNALMGSSAKEIIKDAQDMSIVIFILWSDDSNICMMSKAGSDACSVSKDKTFFFMNQSACHFI